MCMVSFFPGSASAMTSFPLPPYASVEISVGLSLEHDILSLARRSSRSKYLRRTNLEPTSRKGDNARNVTAQDNLRKGALPHCSHYQGP